MKKRRITLLSILLITILVVGGALFSKQGNNEQAIEESPVELLEEEKPKTITYENGDFVYVPVKEDIIYDNDEKTLFYKNILYVSLISEISGEQIEELVSIVDGSIVGRLQGVINVLQLQVEGKSLDELSRLAERLEDVQFVKFAEFSTPSFTSDLSISEKQTYSYNDTWEDSEKEVNEEHPSGKNWWAEAIKAYSAWDYLDNNLEKFETVKVAVLETGNLDEPNTDIKDSISKVSNNNDAEISKHATKVTKVIAANKQSKGIRGVASGVVDVEFTSIGNASEAEVIAAIKSSLEDGNVTIINNSWGSRLMSKKFFEEEKEKKKWFLKLFEHRTYEEYLESEKNSQDKTSATLISELDSLLNSEYSDFLIVQSAGNGYKHYSEGEEYKLKRSIENAAEAELTGYFTNINENTYNQALELDNTLESSLEEIRSHIIVVGGAQKTEDGYQSPVLAGFGNAVDIAAPSEDLYIPIQNNSNSEHQPNWGTSYAAPMVSGAAALAWSYNPELTAGEVKLLLLNNATENVVEEKGDKNSYPMLNMNTFLSENPYYYSTLIETYRTAIIEQWDGAQLDEKDLGPNQYEPSPLSYDYGYIYTDVNNDGIQEMILGVNLEDGRTLINEIYTIVDQTPVKLFESAIRQNLYIYADGTIEESTILNTVKGEAETRFYELGVDGTLELKAGYTEDMVTETYESLIDPYQSMSKEELDSLRQNYGQVIEFSLVPFVLDAEDTE